MELIKTHFGYRLTIGGHDIFLTLSDLEELAQTVQTYITPQEEDIEEVKVNTKFLLAFQPGERKTVRVAKDKIRSMYTAVHAFNAKYPERKVLCKVKKRKNCDEFPSQTRDYVIHRFT
jgi:hypothetical protein